MIILAAVAIVCFTLLLVAVLAQLPDIIRMYGIYIHAPELIPAEEIKRREREGRNYAL